MGEEIRTTSATGGQKGTKIERYDLIPVEPLRLLAELYGKGALKYDDDNWRKGYDWKHSYAALQRHANAFWGGEDIDACQDNCPEGCVNHMNLPHTICAAWHAFTLTEFMREHPEFDNRHKS